MRRIRTGYFYYLIIVQRPDGGRTTVSIHPDEYISLVRRAGNSRALNKLIRAAAAALLPDPRVTRSKQLRDHVAQLLSLRAA